MPKLELNMPETNLQNIILKNLVHNEGFCRKAMPHIKLDYFEKEYRVIYELILSFITKYNKLPNSSVLKIEFDSYDGTLNEQEFINVSQIIDDIDNSEKVDDDWLIDSTEVWCKDRAVYLAIMESITIIDGKSKDKSEGMIPEILSKALAISFDTNVGHDYLADAKERFEFYRKKENKIPFDIDILNTITNGGVTRKSLNILLASTGVGKSLVLCHLAGAALAQGQNVLYITLEMSEEKIAERIDANLLDIYIDQLPEVSWESYNHKIQKIASKTFGKLIIKEYPTGAAHTSHFRALLSELKMKKKFTPDIIFIDYLNICASARLQSSSAGVNSYGYIKAIAEEFRGLGVEFNVPIWSATQVNREGAASSDVELTNTSESWGLPATADLMLALIVTEELEKSGQLLVKQLKNRYNDVNKNKRFTVGIERSKMRLFDIEDPLSNIMNNTDKDKNKSVVSTTPFEIGRKKNNFSNFKV